MHVGEVNNLINMLKFQIKNFHIILIVYLTSLIFTGFIRIVTGADFRDDAHLIPISYIVGITMHLMSKYKKSVRDTKHEPIFIFISSIIALVLYFVTIQVIGSHYFL